MRDARWAEVRAMFPTSQYVRHSVDPAALAKVWSDDSGRAAAWITTHHFAGRPWLVLLGEARAAAELVLEIRAEHPDAVGGITHERSTSLPTDVDFEDSWDWDWFSTDSPAPQRDDPGVSIDWAEEAVFDDLRAVLHAASDWRSVEPGEERAERWAALRLSATPDQAAHIVSCLAVTRTGPHTPSLASVATHPDHRGRGFARDLTAWTTNHLLDEGAPVVTLGMYSDNHTARKVYDTLGFEVGHRFRSGRLREHQEQRPA
jgi:ribosomal protein S18 acetylase RimI-like enzyme